MKSIFGKKVHLGRMALPVWAIALTLVGVAAVAGQAVGPVLSGSVQGSAGLVVSQTVVLKQTGITVPTSSTTHKLKGTDTAGLADDSAATQNDEGTAFTVALETQVGQASWITLELENKSAKLANFILELNAPAGVDIEADQDQDPATNPFDLAKYLALARLNKNTWLGSMPESGVVNQNSKLNILVESKDDAAPGFYTITGRIIQVAN
ncbi:MAG: hypothetical protein HYY01_05995 [Chloroflexi bacterium]|nr:hypothetical protein [Chloroflexota bacterium]